MDHLIEPPKIFCEFVCRNPLSVNYEDEVDDKPRFDFYGEMGMIASCYDIHVAAVVRAELKSLGFVVVDFPEMKG